MTPELRLPAELGEGLLRLSAELGRLEDVEAMALAGDLRVAVERLAGWRAFMNEVTRAWRISGHVVLRGLPTPDPTALLAASLLAGSRFKPYRGGKIVKRFTMSPWTRALSHTLDEGHFHTDLNTAPEPPRVTAIQCVMPDPTPAAGELRVVTLTTLLAELRRRENHRAIAFLVSDEVAMVSDTDARVWRGRIVDDKEIRFHPETLRAAKRRLGESRDDLEDVLAAVKAAALAVSLPIYLEPGDTLLVANRRALHYRGACTVRFRAFPREFDSRSIHVLHLMEEAA